MTPDTHTIAYAYRPRTFEGMTADQQGLLTLRKLRLGGHQRISVQHIQVSNGGQAIVGDVVNSRENLAPTRNTHHSLSVPLFRQVIILYAADDITEEHTVGRRLRVLTPVGSC